MLSPATLAAMALSIALACWAARRDLQLPIWLSFTTFVTTALATILAFGAAFAPVAGLTVTCLLIAEADRRHQLIPDFLTLAALALVPAMPFGDSLIAQLIGAGTLGVTFLIIRQVASARHGAEALGLGDVKLAVAMGALLGPVSGFAAVAVGGIATLLVVGICSRGGAAVAGAPFGIGLAAATAAVAIVRAITL